MSKTPEMAYLNVSKKSNLKATLGANQSYKRNQIAKMATQFENNNIYLPLSRPK